MSAPAQPSAPAVKTSFWRSVFSESDGSGSSSRVIGAFLAVMSAAWISYHLWTTHLLPDAATAGGLAVFSTSHYLANKAAGAIAKQ